MISEEDKIKYVEASKCEDCISWHHHCKAECCKIVFLNINPGELKKPGRFITIQPKLPFNDWRYFSLRDVPYMRGKLRFMKDRIIVAGGKVMYVYPCRLLKGNMCIEHEKGTKPDICKVLTLQTAKLPNQPFQLTDNCLFKYKQKEVEEDGKKSKN